MTTTTTPDPTRHTHTFTVTITTAHDDAAQALLAAVRNNLSEIGEEQAVDVTPPTPAPAYRVRFLYDPDPASNLETPHGTPLPGTAEEYAGNEIHELINPADDPTTGARRLVAYDEYCRYWGNPDRHVVIGVVLDRQCHCCGAWDTAESLWGIDLMDDAPELRTVDVETDGARRPRTYAPDDAAITGYLRNVVDELLGEAGAPAAGGTR